MKISPWLFRTFNLINHFLTGREKNWVRWGKNSNLEKPQKCICLIENLISFSVWLEMIWNWEILEGQAKIRQNEKTVIDSSWNWRSSVLSSYPTSLHYFSVFFNYYCEFLLFQKKGRRGEIALTKEKRRRLIVSWHVFPLHENARSFYQIFRSIVKNSFNKTI